MARMAAESHARRARVANPTVYPARIKVCTPYCRVSLVCSPRALRLALGNGLGTLTRVTRLTLGIGAATRQRPDTPSVTPSPDTNRVLYPLFTSSFFLFSLPILPTPLLLSAASSLSFHQPCLLRMLRFSSRRQDPPLAPKARVAPPAHPPSPWPLVPYTTLQRSLVKVLRYVGSCSVDVWDLIR